MNQKLGLTIKPDLWDQGTPARFGYQKCTNSAGRIKSVAECLSNPTGPPLDFSFMGLTTVDDMALIQRKVKEAREEKARENQVSDLCHIIF